MACLITPCSGSQYSVILLKKHRSSCKFDEYRLIQSVRSYFVNNPEAIHFLLFLFSDRSTPVDFQHADIFSVNTYRFTKTVSKTAARTFVVLDDSSVTQMPSLHQI